MLKTSGIIRRRENLFYSHELLKGGRETEVGVPAFLRSAVALAKAEAGSSSEDRLKAGHQRWCPGFSRSSQQDSA